eukprot:NODE_4167_length_809_cov_43.458944_g4144_i0.p1 GENE.NODE_4167_length_809_cov_43.458944_g4144_i0~~NODE_4167_length_809_cov_43.458944_g4144_i0.p1  ORF type:complete len:207 (+),score=28.19 NODE_4167_length_809_cov_43.458944_g4144_i0:173-793(+)
MRRTRTTSRTIPWLWWKHCQPGEYSLIHLKRVPYRDLWEMANKAWNVLYVADTNIKSNPKKIFQRMFDESLSSNAQITALLKTQGEMTAELGRLKAEKDDVQRTLNRLRSRDPSPAPDDAKVGHLAVAKPQRSTSECSGSSDVRTVGLNSLAKRRRSGGSMASMQSLPRDSRSASPARSTPTLDVPELTGNVDNRLWDLAFEDGTV